MKLSDIFWNAANDGLWDGADFIFSLPRSKYPCIVVVDACHEAGDADRALAFMRSLGVNTDSSSQFYEFKSDHERQGARYAWLMFCHQIALEVERGELVL